MQTISQNRLIQFQYETKKYLCHVFQSHAKAIRKVFKNEQSKVRVKYKVVYCLKTVYLRKEMLNILHTSHTGIMKCKTRAKNLGQQFIKH